MAFLNAYQVSVFFSIFNEGKKSASTPPHFRPLFLLIVEVPL